MESREPNRATTPSFPQRKARSHHCILRASTCGLLGRAWQQKWLRDLYVSQAPAVKVGIFQLTNSALITEAQILQHTVAWAAMGGGDSVAWPTRAPVTFRLLETPLKWRRKLPLTRRKLPEGWQAYNSSCKARWESLQFTAVQSRRGSSKCAVCEPIIELVT
jgi:hypothetical protein